MKTLSLSEAKMKFSALVDEVQSTDEGVAITRNGVPVAVLVSSDEFESWRETLSIRLDEESVSEIREGLDALTRGRAALYTLQELFEEPAGALRRRGRRPK
jgi:prevent-host-death family protein